MNRLEFLEKLKESLEQDLGPQAVQDNVNYYNQYIIDEVRGGKTESEVIEMLGDPWIIARTVIDAGAGQGREEYVYETPQNRQQGRESSGSSLRVFALDTWWKKLLLILCVVGVVMLVFAIVSGIVSLIAPILIPVLIIAILLRLLRGRR